MRGGRAIRGCVYALLLLGIAACVVVWWDDLSQLWREHALTFVVAAMAMVAGIIVQAHNFRCFLPQPSAIGLWRLSHVWALGALANYLGPFQPGLALRVLWLRSMDVTVGNSLLATWRQLSVSIWISLFGLSVGFMLSDPRRNAILALGFLVVFFAGYLLRGYLASLVEGLRRPVWVRTKKDVIAAAIRHFPAVGVLGVVAQYAIGTMLLWFVYRQFGAEVGLGQAVLMACVVYVSTLVAVLPGNLGVLEAIYVLGGHATGLTAQESAALALLLRAAQVVASLALASMHAWNLPPDGD
ncbi:MAG TPA: lysylphosphatidylglycerol synthase domain-containing protein [Luteimonas sp.]|nr:lysylphosphatidylglycerol synthase domain-containing protein [Luteimonas sp.]